MDKVRLRSIEDRCKWRGYEEHEKSWIYGYITRVLNEKATSIEHWHVATETVGQYIGRNDKNGNEIYEGDIIALRGKYPKVIGYDNKEKAFCMANISDLRESTWRNIWMIPAKGWWKEYQDDIEIIGNRWDNPELFK